MKELSKKTIFSLTVLMFLLTFILFVPSNIALALTSSLENGKYIANFTTNMPDMGLASFENRETKAIVEVVDDNYYLTISINGDKVSDLKLNLGKNKIGEVIKTEGNIVRHTYTISKANLSSTLNFSVYIKAMKSSQNFTINVDLASLNKIDEVDVLLKRPAEFVPTIITNATDLEVEFGSYYIVPKATATFDELPISVTQKAYYIDGKTDSEVEITNGKIKLDKIGKYKVVFYAETPLFTNNLGNNASSEVTVYLQSKVGAAELVKIEDKNNILPVGYSVVAGKVDENSETYKTAKQKMLKIADNFEIFSYELISSEGSNINLTKDISVYFSADTIFDRTNIEVYYLDNNGELTKVESSNYGYYVKIDTNKMGNFIVCEPGVKFVMPMYGYALITVFSVILLIVLIVVPIVVVKKKKKKEMIANGTYIEKSKKRKSK